jgi:hypothetical protein
MALRSWHLEYPKEIRSSSMKLFKTVFITFGLLLWCVINGNADPIYTWKDSKGVTHITQEPPPQTAKSIDVMDYPAQPAPPPPRPAARDSSNQQQGNPNQAGGQAGSGSSTGITPGDDDDIIEYDYTGGPYRRTLRQYERRGERLDNREPIRESERPERIQPRLRGR